MSGSASVPSSPRAARTARRNAAHALLRPHGCPLASPNAAEVRLLACFRGYFRPGGLPVAPISDGLIPGFLRRAGHSRRGHQDHCCSAQSLPASGKARSLTTTASRPRRRRRKCQRRAVTWPMTTSGRSRVVPAMTDPRHPDAPVPGCGPPGAPFTPVSGSFPGGPPQTPLSGDGALPILREASRLASRGTWLLVLRTLVVCVR